MPRFSFYTKRLYFRSYLWLSIINRPSPGAKRRNTVARKTRNKSSHAITSYTHIHTTFLLLVAFHYSLVFFLFF